MTTNTRIQTLYDIRDARGLSADEKHFLMTVELRGKCKASMDLLCADMGIGRTRFYSLRKSLSEKELLSVKTVNGKPTVYRVNAELLEQCRPLPYPDTPVAVRQPCRTTAALSRPDRGGVSDSGTDPCRTPIREEDKKKTMKKKSKSAREEKSSKKPKKSISKKKLAKDSGYSSPSANREGRRIVTRKKNDIERDIINFLGKNPSSSALEIAMATSPTKNVIDIREHLSRLVEDGKVTEERIRNVDRYRISA